MAEPKFEDYLREREQIEKQNNMERLMEEFKEDMRKKKVIEQKQMVFDDTPRFELKSLDSLVNEFEADNGRKPTSIDDLKRYFYNKYGEDFLSKIDEAVANESKDVAMETQGQGRGNQVFDMLRARLPQEVTDDVVQLISYDKTAFADFASIKNQEDVTSFNDKYGTQLVIDVATV